MQSIRQIQRLNDAELAKCVPPNGSWHTDYRDTAYIYIGGLPFELSEGDILTIFSQYGNPVHISLMRDKETGKSRGFAFLKYEDQRSCDLAVDNLSGAGVLGRVLSVDHTRYKLKEGEIEGEGLEEVVQEEDDDTDREGDKRRKRRRTSDTQEERRPMVKEEIELAKLLKEHDDDDPMKAYLVKEKKEQITEALKELSVRKHKHHGESRRHETDSERHRRRSRDRTRRVDVDDAGRDSNAEREGDRSRRRKSPAVRHRSQSSEESTGKSRKPRYHSTDDERSPAKHSHRRRSRSRDRSPEDGVRRRRDGHRAR